MLVKLLSSAFIAAAIALASSAFAAGEVRQPAGFYVMQALHQANVPDDVLASQNLAGIHLRDQWQLLEPTPDAETFSWLDGQIARAKSFGKQVTLGIYAGTSSPAWLNLPLVNGVPIPWDPAVTAAHDEMVAELGARYRSETAIVAVHISAPATNNSLEMHFPDGLTSAPGYSDAKIIDSWVAAIDAYSAAFPNNALVLDVAMVPDVSGAITDAVTAYARQVLGDRANFIHCSLKATTSPTAPHQQTIVNLHQDGARIGFEMVGPSTDASRFGGPFSDALAIGQAAGADWYQIYQADVPSIPDNFFGVPGDYNGNGVVDAADYTVWRDSLGQSGVGLTSDGNGNGQIDAGDYNVWKADFRATVASGSGVSAGAAIPEPASLVMLLVGTLILWARFLEQLQLKPLFIRCNSDTARATQSPFGCHAVATRIGRGNIEIRFAVPLPNVSTRQFPRKTNAR